MAELEIDTRKMPLGKISKKQSKEAFGFLKEIGEHLVISRKTAAHHVEHIYAKTGTTNRALASLFAASHGLIPDPATETEAGLTPGTTGTRSTGPASR